MGRIVSPAQIQHLTEFDVPAGCNSWIAKGMEPHLKRALLGKHSLPQQELTQTVLAHHRQGIGQDRWSAFRAWLLSSIAVSGGERAVSKTSKPQI